MFTKVLLLLSYLPSYLWPMLILEGFQVPLSGAILYGLPPSSRRTSIGNHISVRAAVSEQDAVSNDGSRRFGLV
jgi:hypothetical protein